MFQRALVRLFLILFPLSLLALALFMTYRSSLSGGAPASLQNQCPSYLGLSFFPLGGKSPRLKKHGETPQPPVPTISRAQFFKSLKTFKEDLKAEQIPLKNVIFTFPLALTKEEEWIVSDKTFFVSPLEGRLELSHLTYSRIRELYRTVTGENKALPLKLEDLFSYLPNQNFLFYLKGRQREKMMKALSPGLKNKTKGVIYLSSLDEKLLREISALNTNWKVLHSFKSLLKAQMMSFFSRSFGRLPGQGLIIPSHFFPSSQSLAFLKSRNKILFVEKDPPYRADSRALIGRAYALVSSQPKEFLSIVPDGKPCFTKK